VLLNYHSGEAEDHLHKWPSAVRTLHRVNSIVVPSAFLVRVFGRFGLRASAIANMVDVRAFEFQSRDAARPRFLVNRNFEAHYNVACVLRAFALIQKQLPDAVLTVAGDGPQRADLQRLAEDLDLRNTRFVGRVRPDAMPLLYQEHDIWLNASNVDNMPLSILECFSSGVVAVSTSAGGIPDMVDHGRTGLLVPCNDSIALAAAALNVVNTPTFFSQLKRNALQECEKYTWTAVRAQWLEAYRELAAKSGDRIP
jgi:glycosyltransferase involved in cell wall biosynthesis